MVLIVVWMSVLRPPSKKNLEKAVSKAEEDGMQFKIILELADEYLSNEENVQELSYIQDRDPFSSNVKTVSLDLDEVVSSELFENLVLKGILWDNENPLAIINGKIVGQGKMIGGVKVKKIYPNSVRLEARGQEKTLLIEGRENLNGGLSK